MPPASEPWTVVTTDRHCALCGTLITAGSMARRTRGLERHNGGWRGICCKDKP